MELGNRPKIPSKRGRKKVFHELQHAMIYVGVDLNEKWDLYAHSYGVSKSQIAREALEMRLNSGSNPYVNGYNNGIDAVINEAKLIDAFKMTFPSGKTFADLLKDTTEKLRRDNGTGKP